MNRSIKKNVIFSFLLQFTTLFFPILTSPYISRILGANNLGKINFVNNVVNWFVVLSLFGTSIYGIREVAKKRENKKELSLFFSEIMMIKLVCTIIVCIIYFLMINYIPRFKEDYILFLLNIITIILNLFSLDWFYQGLEDYQYITIRSLVFKIISLILIFLLIKEEKNYLIYSLINIFALSASNILNFIYSRKYVNWFISLNLKKHIKKLFVFFITNITSTAYSLIDTLIIGFLCPSFAVAFYTRGKMFINIGNALPVAFINATSPRLMNSYSRKSEYYNQLRQTKDFILLITIPILCGLIILGDNMMFLFGGDEFIIASKTLYILSPIVVITPLAIWNIYQRIYPAGEEKLLIKINIFSAICSGVLTLLFVKLIGYNGAAVVWVFIELSCCIIELGFMKKKDGFSILDVNLIKDIISSIVMSFGLYYLKTRLSISWINLVLVIFFSICIYIIMLILTNHTIIKSQLIQILKRKEGLFK